MLLQLRTAQSQSRSATRSLADVARDSNSNVAVTETSPRYRSRDNLITFIATPRSRSRAQRYHAVRSAQWVRAGVRDDPATRALAAARRHTAAARATARPPRLALTACRPTAPAAAGHGDLLRTPSRGPCGRPGILCCDFLVTK